MPQRARRASLSGLDHPNASRLHELLAALQAGETLNADQAAESLGVSRRTVARDLKFLREDLGLDIHYEQASRSYRLVSPDRPEGDSLPSNSALAAFLVARHALAALGGSTDRGLLEATTERLVEALPPTLRVEEPAVIPSDPTPAALAFGHIVALHAAIERRHRVAIRQTTPGPPDAFVPRALLSRRGRWWAVAEDGEGFRFVSLSRVSTVRDLGEDAGDPTPLNLDGLLEAHPIICDEPGHRSYHVTLSALAANRVEQVPPPGQHRLLPHARGADLHLCAASVTDAARWCLGIGEGLEATEPELRAAIVRTAEEIAARHR